MILGTSLESPESDEEDDEDDDILEEDEAGDDVRTVDVKSSSLFALRNRGEVEINDLTGNIGPLIFCSVVSSCLICDVIKGLQVSEFRSKDFEGGHISYLSSHLFCSLKSSEYFLLLRRLESSLSMGCHVRPEPNLGKGTTTKYLHTWWAHSDFRLFFLAFLKRKISCRRDGKCRV